MATPNQKTLSSMQEQRYMKRDFIKTILINSVFLALLIGLYFLNQASGFLEKFTIRF